MFIPPRRPLQLLVCSLILVCVMIALLAPAQVRGDVGVQPVLPGGSSIQPEAQTPIQMAAEVVTMNVRLATAADNALVTLAPQSYGFQGRSIWYPGIAEVAADFTMMNPTHEAVSLTAWFPLASALEKVDWNLNPDETVPRIARFQVSIGGKQANYTVSELPNPKGADKPLLPWASFPVTFPAGADTLIHVSYLLPLQPSIKGNEMIVYYIFQTGAGWAGPIGKAELILNLPYPASAGTLAGIAPGRLSLPPYFLPGPGELPFGAELKGNQARWTWTNFEPGPQDDFAVWLLQPAKWQALEAARAATQARPQDGQAWLDLGAIYYSVACSGFNRPLVFSSSYIPPGLEAFRKAAALLPESSAAHAGLALLTLATIYGDKNAPPDVLLSILDEYRIAKELAAKNPSQTKGEGAAGYLFSWLEEVMLTFTYNETTATANAGTLAAYHATASVPPQTATLTPPPQPTLTTTRLPSSTPVPSTTSLPALTPAPAVEETAVDGQGMAVILAAGAVGLAVVGYLSWKRGRRKERNQ